MKLNNRIWIYTLMVIGMFLIGCSKDDKNNIPIPSGTATDIEGNVYHTIVIGTQVWMIENLKAPNIGMEHPYPM